MSSTSSTVNPLVSSRGTMRRGPAGSINRCLQLPKAEPWQYLKRFLAVAKLAAMFRSGAHNMFIDFFPKEVWPANENKNNIWCRNKIIKVWLGQDDNGNIKEAMIVSACAFPYPCCGVASRQGYEDRSTSYVRMLLYLLLGNPWWYLTD